MLILLTELFICLQINVQLLSNHTRNRGVRMCYRGHWLLIQHRTSRLGFCNERDPIGPLAGGTTLTLKWLLLQNSKSIFSWEGCVMRSTVSAVWKVELIYLAGEGRTHMTPINSFLLCGAFHIDEIYFVNGALWIFFFLFFVVFKIKREKKPQNICVCVNKALISDDRFRWSSVCFKKNVWTQSFLRWI